MKKGRFKRNWPIILFGVIVFIFSFYFKISPKSLKNFTDIMSASLSFSAIVTAIFFASFSLIPTSGSNKLVVMMEDLGTEIKIMDRLLVATFLSFISLFFSKTDTDLISILVVSSWLSSTVMMFLSSFFVLRTLILLVETYNNFKNK
ncbi:Uncharacterised protein [Streptococcus pyogenes]|nr:Uncharacterised protein [Streptococcus pyogenes]